MEFRVEFYDQDGQLLHAAVIVAESAPRALSQASNEWRAAGGNMHECTRIDTTRAGERTHTVQLPPPITPREVLAKRGTPVVDAMRYWLSGDVSVPSLTEFFDRFGNRYRDHLRTMFDRPLAEFSYETRDLITQSMDSLAVHLERDLFIGEFAFAVPTREALDCLAKYSPLLEIGAGSGAWAKLLAMRGADIIATDPALETFWALFHAGGSGRWETFHYPVLELEGKTAVRRWPDRNVFCCWPSLKGTWLRQAARAMLPGRALLVVREEATADDRTWDYVEYAFKPVAIGAGEDDWVDNRFELPSWHFLHDRLEVWIKKTHRELAATPGPPPPPRDEDDEEIDVALLAAHLGQTVSDE